MPVKEEWGILVRKDSKLAQRESIEAVDLVGIPLVTGARDFCGELISWLGGLYDQLEIAAVGNLLYNEAMLVENGMEAVLCIQLNCIYENLRFIPLHPAVESRTALVWKKDAVFSRAASAFIDSALQYLKSISGNNI